MMAGNCFLHMMNDKDAGIIVLLWMIGNLIVKKNRVWLRWF